MIKLFFKLLVFLIQGIKRAIPTSLFQRLKNNSVFLRLYKGWLYKGGLVGSIVPWNKQKPVYQRFLKQQEGKLLKLDKYNDDFILVVFVYSLKDLSETEKSIRLLSKEPKKVYLIARNETIHNACEKQGFDNNYQLILNLSLIKEQSTPILMINSGDILNANIVDAMMDRITKDTANLYIVILIK